MRTEVLETRLAWLKKNQFQSVSLDEGLQLLKTRKLPPRTIVITIDDGFRSVAELAAPIFQKYGFSATVYVTTYYAAKETPIFRLAIQYYAWKAGEEKVRTALTARLPEAQSCRLMEIIEFAETNLKEPARIAIARDLALDLGEDYDELARTGVMSLMNAEEVRGVGQYGIDVQLHTHRHRLPDNESAIAEEINDNREFLEPLLDRRLTHFCYPSGKWLPSQLTPLAKLGIATATTCEPGMNPQHSHPLALKRFLDRDDFTQIEFEAELRGYKELMRVIRDFVTRRTNSVDKLTDAIQ